MTRYDGDGIPVGISECSECGHLHWNESRTRYEACPLASEGCDCPYRYGDADRKFSPEEIEARQGVADELRDEAEEAYLRNFCPECGFSPCIEELPDPDGSNLLPIPDIRTYANLFYEETSS